MSSPNGLFAEPPPGVTPTSLKGLARIAAYAIAPERAWAHKPSTISYEEAATLPQAAILAIQGLQGRGGIGPGSKIRRSLALRRIRAESETEADQDLLVAGAGFEPTTSGL
jgi:NADPH:quinone reductase-like Zn-dependent oxidoreductase